MASLGNKSERSRPVFYYKFLLNENYKSSKPVMLNQKIKIEVKKENQTGFSKLRNYFGL